MAAKIPKKHLFNPCGCWALKDGCITVGIWTIIYAILQLGLFTWQTQIIQLEKSRAANSRAEWFAVLRKDDPRYPAYYETYYQTPEEKFYMGLFVVQVVQLIACFFLLGAGAALIWGIVSETKHFFWPYFPVVILTLLCAGAYSGLWLASPNAPSDPESLQTIKSIRDRIPYWAILTIFELLTIAANVYSFLIVIAAYLRLSDGTLRDYGYYLERRDRSGKISADVSSLSKVATATTYDNISNGGMPANYDTKVATNDNFWNEHYATAGGIRPPLYNLNGPAGPLPAKEPIPPDPLNANLNRRPQDQLKDAFTKHWLNTVEVGAQPPSPSDPDQPHVAAGYKAGRGAPEFQSSYCGKRRRHRRHRRDYDSRSYTAGTTSDTTRKPKDRRHRRNERRRYDDYHTNSESNDTSYDSGSSYYDSDDLTTATRTTTTRRSGNKKGTTGKKHHRHHRNRADRDYYSDDSISSYDSGHSTGCRQQKPSKGAVQPPEQQQLPAVGRRHPSTEDILEEQTLTIPQHIILPPLSPVGPDADQGPPRAPKKYQINSEITIRYKKQQQPQPPTPTQPSSSGGLDSSGTKSGGLDSQTGGGELPSDYSTTPTLDITRAPPVAPTTTPSEPMMNKRGSTAV